MQIFSHTFSAAINTCVYVQALPDDAISTDQLIKHFDTLFDCCNSISFKDPKKCRCTLTIQSPHIGELINALAFIKSLKGVEPTSKEDKTKNLKCLKGWCMTINASVSIWEKMYQEGIVSFLVTRQLNQDPWENFFGSICQQGGNSDNPTPIHFFRAYRKLFHIDLLPVAGSCEIDDNKLIAGLQHLDHTFSTILIKVNQ